MTVLLISGLVAMGLVVAWELSELISGLIIDVQLQDEVDRESDDEVY